MNGFLTCHSMVNKRFISIVSKWFILSVDIWRSSKDYHYWTGIQDTKLHFQFSFIILLLLTDKNYWSKIWLARNQSWKKKVAKNDKIKQNWTRPEKCDICFWIISEYQGFQDYQGFAYFWSRDWALSCIPKFFLFPNFLPYP